MRTKLFAAAPLTLLPTCVPPVVTETVVDPCEMHVTAIAPDGVWSVDEQLVTDTDGDGTLVVCFPVAVIQQPNP